MESRKKSWYVLIVGFVVLAACAPKQQVEWDVQLGKLTDGGTGFHSYYSGLSRIDLQNVCFSLASAPEIEGRVTINTGAMQEIYPSLPYYRELTFIEPSALGSLLSECDQSTHASVDTLEIGYFAKTIYDAGNGYVTEVRDPGKAPGVYWGQLTERGTEKLRIAIEEIRNRAAEEGVNCIADFSVCFREIAVNDSDLLIIISGRALTFGKIEENNRIKSTLQLLVN